MKINYLTELKLSQFIFYPDEYANMVNEDKLSFVNALCELTTKEMKVKSHNAANTMVKVVGFPHFKELSGFKTKKIQLLFYVTFCLLFLDGPVAARSISSEKRFIILKHFEREVPPIKTSLSNLLYIIFSAKDT